MAHLKGAKRERYVQDMFTRIARRYDRLNTVMTAGRHHMWRRIAARMAVASLTGPVLDVASGTGDFAIELACLSNSTSVVGIDFATEMLTVAQSKAVRSELTSKTNFLTGDAHTLPFPDGEFICATVGFGVRNFIELPKAMSEMVRVVRTGGRVVVLEIVRMDGGGLISKLFRLYFKYITPWLGAVFARDIEAYTYLPESVQEFVTTNRLVSIMREAGLTNITVKKLALGSVAILVGEKVSPRVQSVTPQPTTESRTRTIKSSRHLCQLRTRQQH